MRIDFQRNNGIPLHLQIAQAFADRIKSQTLDEHTALPSVRQLAQRLQVSVVTVLKAYRQLESDGYVTVIQGKGTFIKKPEQKVMLRETTPFDWQHQVEDYLPRAQFAPFYLTKARYHMSSMIVDSKLLPNHYFSEQMKTVFEKQPHMLSAYSEIQGDLVLRQSMKRYLQSVDLHCEEENILVTTGLQQGIDLVARTFIGQGDLVVMEEPTYPGAVDCFRGRGATILTVPVDENGMKVEYLRKICQQFTPKLVFTNPTFHNPTGTVLSLKRRKQLLELAQQMNFLIVEDDPYSELFFNKKPPAPIKSFDKTGHVIYLKGLSKIYAPSCRTALLVGNGPIFQRLLASKANADLGSPLLTQKLILPLLGSTRMQAHAAKLRTAFQLRRDALIVQLKKHAPPNVTWYEPLGGLTIWLSLPQHIDLARLKEEAEAQGITFLPGDTCYVQTTKHKKLRLSYSYINEQLIEHAIPLLCQLLAK